MDRYELKRLSRTELESRLQVLQDQHETYRARVQGLKDQLRDLKLEYAGVTLQEFETFKLQFEQAVDWDPASIWACQEQGELEGTSAMKRLGNQFFTLKRSKEYNQHLIELRDTRDALRTVCQRESHVTMLSMDKDRFKMLTSIL